MDLADPLIRLPISLRKEYGYLYKNQQPPETSSTEKLTTTFPLQCEISIGTKRLNFVEDTVTKQVFELAQTSHEIVTAINHSYYMNFKNYSNELADKYWKLKTLITTIKIKKNILAAQIKYVNEKYFFKIPEAQQLRRSTTTTPEEEEEEEDQLTLSYIRNVVDCIKSLSEIKNIDTFNDDKIVQFKQHMHSLQLLQQFEKGTEEE